MSDVAELTRIWEAKLRAEGLGLNQPLSLSGTSGLRRGAPKAAYYARALQIVHILDAGVDAQVWELHAEGITVREIALRVGISKTSVHRRIAMIRKQAEL